MHFDCISIYSELRSFTSVLRFIEASTSPESCTGMVRALQTRNALAACCSRFNLMKLSVKFNIQFYGVEAVECYVGYDNSQARSWFNDIAFKSIGYLTLKPNNRIGKNLNIFLYIDPS